MLSNVLKIAGVCAVMALSSCTLGGGGDEPDAPADNYRLTSIKAGGILTAYKFDYDTKGRLTGVVGEDEEVTFTYQGNDVKPSTIEGVMYSYYYDEEADKEKAYANERMTWSDIEYNGLGLMTSATYVEVTGYPSYDFAGYATIEYETTTSTEYNDYDAAGHLLKHTLHTPGEMPEDEYTTFVWSGDLLVRSYDSVEPVETIEYEYSDVVNTLGQYDPFTAIGGVMGMTGVYGKAPARFVKKMTYMQSGYNDVKQLSYALSPNGLIDRMRLNEEGETATLMFNYKKF